MYGKRYNTSTFWLVAPAVDGSKIVCMVAGIWSKSISLKLCPAFEPGNGTLTNP